MYFCRQIINKIMTYILHLESSTSVCSVALSKDGQFIDLMENAEGLNHARLLGVFVQDILQRNQVEAGQLAAVAVSAGPGSYTGLRIGVSLAKGICYANQIPLIPVSPLQALAAQLIERATELRLDQLDQAQLVPMIDARRMEVYTARYNSEAEELEEVQAKVIDENAFSELLNENKLLFFGNGATKCKDTIQHENAQFIDGLKTSAQFMCGLAWKAFRNEQFADLAYFEPFYLKDFIAGKPRKNILKS